MPDAGSRNSCIASLRWTCGSRQSSTVTRSITAAQEVAALILAHAVVAQSRIEAASEADCEVFRISFGKTLAMGRSLWLVLAAGNGNISGKQASALTERVMALLADAILPKKDSAARQ